ncbi:MAG TPA: hypothetical protein VGK78_13175 [Nocardioides sp.]|uniref:hypothetical protein n=1 Tax=Nocardioides sp. TaxID=35761 RepID=UPI002F41F37A
MSETAIEALDVARAAYEKATEALRMAEAAARSSGVEVAPTVVDELTVKRINVVEDDGTLRVVLGNSTMGRTAPMRGRLVQHPGRNETAGLLFVNDEGTECGALTFAGFRSDSGKEQIGFLTFDDYEQNEGFRFGMHQEGSVVQRWLEFADLPDWSLVDMIEEMEGLDDEAAQEVQERHLAGHSGLGASRMRLARESDGSVRLVLRDARGQDRLRFVVPADGEPRVEILDVDGVPRSLLPD